MGVSPAEANSLVRLSLGRETTEAEIDRLLEILPVALRRARGQPG
jgi:cysteine sulfinate desulfinase/cysteine desulfurase-like protein